MTRPGSHAFGPTLIARPLAGLRSRCGATASGLFLVLGVGLDAVSVFAFIAYRRLDRGLGEIACRGSQAGLIEGLIDTTLFLNRQRLNAPLRAPTARPRSRRS